VRKFEELGIGQPQHVVSLRKLMDLEQKVATYINSYLATRQIGTLHDLEHGLAAQEGVEVLLVRVGIWI
jgi:hypothetical protein